MKYQTILKSNFSLIESLLRILLASNCRTLCIRELNFKIFCCGSLVLFPSFVSYLLEYGSLYFSFSNRVYIKWPINCWIFSECYDALQCGYKCTTGNHRPAFYGPTPNYRRKVYYLDYQCVFDDCEQYKINCEHCPEPETHPDFSIYTVRKDCRHCYERI